MENGGDIFVLPDNECFFDNNCQSMILACYQCALLCYHGTEQAQSFVGWIYAGAKEKHSCVFICMAHLRCKTLNTIFFKNYRGNTYARWSFSKKKITEGIVSQKIPAEAQNQYRQASKLLHQGKTEDALDCFKHAVEIAPNYTEALHETGNCLQDLGRRDEASVYYSRALQEIGDRLCEIGRYEESTGRYWAAIRRYEEASKYYQPEFTPDPVNKGAHPLKTQDYTKVHPDDTEVH